MATSSPHPGTEPWNWKAVVTLLARVGVGAAFLIMGAIKTAHPVTFLKQIHQYNMVPDGLYVLLNGMAAVLPWIEIVCGALLVLGIAVRGSALLLLVMLIVFTTAIIIRALGIYHAGNLPFCAIKFDCGCGSGEQFTCHKVPENLLLITCSAIALFSRSSRACLLRNIVPAQTPWRIEGY